MLAFLPQIVDKALEEPKYSSLYAQLCLRLAEDAPNFDNQSSEIQSAQKQSTVSVLSFSNVVNCEDLSVCNMRFNECALVLDIQETSDRKASR